MECGKENIREDTFLDIPLPIRPFGKETAYGSVVSIVYIEVFKYTSDDLSYNSSLLVKFLSLVNI
jgi:hypothetical protein